MLEILIHKFIKDYEQVNEPQVRKRYGMFSSVIGIICNVCLFAAKLVIGLFANSISIISDSVNNLSDCATCIVTMFGYKMAAKPADKDHPFGHGRMEYLTSLVIAAAILIVGF
ncbi:MAG: cation diffusion facilitator family transporter, partial [Wujia sp.]